MGSEAPCCGGGLSGNCLLIIHFLFQFLKTPNPTFSLFLQISNISPLPHLNVTLFKSFEKSSKNSQIIIELRTVPYCTIFGLNEIFARYLRKKVEINTNNTFNRTAPLTLTLCRFHIGWLRILSEWLICISQPHSDNFGLFGLLHE